MARYGLLDLEIRRQREDLQYNSENSRFNYPPRPVYCSVDSSTKVIVLALNQASSLSSFNGLESNKYHVNLQNNEALLFKQLMYGIPSNLLMMTQDQAVISELLEAFQVETFAYTQNSNSLGDNIENIDFDAFHQQIKDYQSGFFIGILNPEELAKIDFAGLGENAKILLINRSEQEDHYRLHSNFVDSSVMSGNIDVTPTVLREFGCLAEIERYSVGQALQAPTRSWLVDTQNSNLVVVKYPLMTKVASDGSFEVTNLEDQSKVLIDIDTNLLSRSIKHLKDFSD